MTAQNLLEYDLLPFLQPDNDYPSFPVRRLVTMVVVFVFWESFYRLISRLNKSDFMFAMQIVAFAHSVVEVIVVSFIVAKYHSFFTVPS